MSTSLEEILNLELAWKRVKLDLAQTAFVKNPFEVALVELEPNAWLNSLRDSIINGGYNPHPATICDIPKINGAIRPAAFLQLSDRVVYAACVGACYKQIYQVVHWATEISDFSTPLNFNHNDPRWVKGGFRLWRDFAEKSIEEIEKAASHVVIADIAAYYENIDISMLISDLKQTNAPREAIDLLSSCLNRWAQTQGRSIPQGYSSSDILSKLYMTAVDRHLRALGYVHYRYSDDIRIFCGSKREARRALLDLITLLRRRGLNIQSAKTGIYTAHEARLEIEGVQPIIQHTANRYIDKIRELLPTDNPYITMLDAENIYIGSPDDTPIEVIQEVFTAYFIETRQSKFNKTLFRFLLKRLGKQKDRFALDYCKTMLEAHPEETIILLTYFKSVNAYAEMESTITGFLNSGDAMYSHQLYLLIEWYALDERTPSEQLIEVVRRLTFDPNQPFYVHAMGRYFLGKFGAPHDLEALEHSYADSKPSEQVEIICALRRMEKDRRNAFLARAENDSEMHKRAVRLVRTNVKL